METRGNTSKNPAPKASSKCEDLVRRYVGPCRPTGPAHLGSVHHSEVVGLRLRLFVCYEVLDATKSGSICNTLMVLNP